MTISAKNLMSPTIQASLPIHKIPIQQTGTKRRRKSNPKRVVVVISCIKFESGDLSMKLT